MKSIIRLLITTFSALVASNALAVTQPTTFLGPTARIAVTTPFTNTTALSFLGEAGRKNFRINGTAAWRIDEASRVKITGEYLWQDITYKFLAGNTDEWMQQGAAGAAYQFNFLTVRFKPQVNLDLWLSHARSRSLSHEFNTFVASDGNIISLSHIRRIAGSHARGASPGLAFSPWTGAVLGADANYDQVTYDNFGPVRHSASGWGGKARISQTWENWRFGFIYDARKIYTNYAANIQWTPCPFHAGLSWGLFGDYTHGRNSLPNTYNIGISADYFFEPYIEPRTDVKAEANLKGEIKVPVADDFLYWAADPAVYMPQVLAVADEEFEETLTNITCAAPVLISTLSNVGPINTVNGTPFTITPIAVATAFSSASTLTYSISTTQPSGVTNTLVIDPTTGIITGDVVNVNGNTSFITVTVTGTSSCGSAVTTFDIIITNSIT